MGAPAFDLWLIHPRTEACDVIRQRFEEFDNVHVKPARFEDLEPHDAFVTAGNSYGMMTAGIDAAVVRYFGDELMQRVQSRVMDEYLGEQPVGTAFIIETGYPERPFIVHAPTMRTPSSINGTDAVYRATWAALLAVHAHNVREQRTIESLVFPSLGTGFGAMSFDESARQMAVAYRHYLNPPHRIDWDHVIEREKAIYYDDGRRTMR